MEKLEHFPNSISKVKQIIFKEVMRYHYKQFVAEQDILKKLTTEESLLAGLALLGNAFREPKHRDSGCQCEKGFTVIRCSLNITRWKDQEIDGVQMMILNLLGHGYLAKELFLPT